MNSHIRSWNGKEQLVNNTSRIITQICLLFLLNKTYWPAHPDDPQGLRVASVIEFSVLSSLSVLIIFSNFYCSINILENFRKTENREQRTENRKTDNSITEATLISLWIVVVSGPIGHVLVL